nr:recombination repair protein 1-like [Aegilops tauschii subsp. strangulata]
MPGPPGPLPVAGGRAGDAWRERATEARGRKVEEEEMKAREDAIRDRDAELEQLAKAHATERGRLEELGQKLKAEKAELEAKAKSPLLQPTVGAAGPERQFLPDQAESDVDDPDLGAAALEDDAEGGGGETGGSKLRASLEDWPDDDAGEVTPCHQPGVGQPGASSSAVPDAQGGAKKRQAVPSLFGSRPKKPKDSAAATKRDEAAAKAIRFRKEVKKPQLVSAAPLSLEKSSAASIVDSAETPTTTQRIDPAADLREAWERNAQEAREEQEPARLEKAEVEKAEAAALKKPAEAEAADTAKKQAEEAVHPQSALRAAAFNSKVLELDQRAVDLSESRKANATLQQQLGEANTALRAKEEERSKLAEERDRLVAQLAEQADLLKKVRKEAEDKETGLLAEFVTERSTWTDKEAMLTSGFHEIEDIVDDFFPGHSDAANQAIEADREGRGADGAQIAADAPEPLASRS